MVRGSMKYVPKEMLEELENIKKNLNITVEADVFRKVAENSKIAREIRFTIDFNSRKKK